MSTTVTVWLHVAVWPQLSTACQVRVMTRGQTPLVAVLTTVIVTPPLGSPALGQQGFTAVGGSKFQAAAQFTVFGGAHWRLNGPVMGATTVKGTAHWIGATPASSTVTVTICVPGPTGVPAAGFWLHPML